MLRKFFRLFVALPLAVAVITLFVANRHHVKLVLDPFNPQSPAIFLDLPLYVYLAAALFAGIMIGGISSWISQSRWRKTARRRTREAQQWRSEAERLTRQLDVVAKKQAESTPSRPQLAAG